MAESMRSQNIHGMLVPGENDTVTVTGKKRLAKIVSEGVSKRTGPPGMLEIESVKLN